MRNLIGRDPEQFISDNPRCVVFIRAPWCGRPCESLMPTLKEIEAENPQVSFGHANADGCEAFVSKHQVNALPTVLGFVNGELKASSVLTSDKAKIIANLEGVLNNV